MLFPNQAADIIAVSTSLLDTLPAVTAPTESKLHACKLWKPLICWWHSLVVYVLYATLFYDPSVLLEVLWALLNLQIQFILHEVWVWGWTF